MALLIIFFLVSIVFSFLCSIWEAVLLSITPARVEILYEEGTTIGKRLKGFKEKIDRPLAAILTLNTFAHTIGAVGVGVQANKIWGESLMSGIIVPIVMTIGILILSEIIPKTLGASYWKRLIPFTVNSIQVILVILFPLVWVSQLITKFLKKGSRDSVLNRSDISAIAAIGEKHGVILQDESRIIQNLINFDNILTADIMTPRTVVIAANEKQTIRGFYEQHPKLRFSRIPIFQEAKDNITGFVLKDEVLSSIIQKNGEEPLESIKRKIMVVPFNMALPELFSTMVEKREQIALVVDEFGGMAGLATMEDILETLLGMEIMDEMDNIQDMRMLARKNWEKRAKNLGLIE
jgi:CBS domain containing-hemolysin-like protein